MDRTGAITIAYALLLLAGLGNLWFKFWPEGLWLTNGLMLAAIVAMYAWQYRRIPDAAGKKAFLRRRLLFLGVLALLVVAALLSGRSW